MAWKRQGAGCWSAIESLGLKAAAQRASLLLGRNAVLRPLEALRAHRHQLLHRLVHRRAFPQDQNLAVGQVLEDAPEHQHEVQGRPLLPIGERLSREALEAAGARLLYRPPYSPDFNLIEQIVSKLKRLLRTRV